MWPHQTITALITVILIVGERRCSWWLTGSVIVTARREVTTLGYKSAFGGCQAFSFSSRKLIETEFTQ